MEDPASAFGDAYDKKFRLLTKGSSHAEIPLFRKMQETLTGLNGNFRVEEYHGGDHQVTFQGNLPFLSSNPRCELSDLMIITFSASSNAARLTYLQAKSERATLQSACGRLFSADLQQWYLLANRPQVSGVGKFHPPPELLSGAVLPSIGSFAFFYKDPNGDFQTYYAAANNLVHPISHSKRKGKLQAIGPCGVKSTSNYPECVAACGNKSFAESLFRLEIGTPIDRSIDKATETRNWIASNLRICIKAAQEEGSPSELAQELIEILNPLENQLSNGLFGAKSLIIIKSNADITHPISRNF